MKQFEELGLSQDILEAVNKAGFEIPSEIQKKAIPLAMAGKDIIGGSATGSGKTLAFAIPIIEKLKSNGNVQALVLTPTRELAEQVADSIRKFSKSKGLEVLAVYGGVGIEPQMRKLAVTDIVVGTPGRILDHMNRKTLNLDYIKFLVLDEVDRMFDMGFHRDVERIIKECPTDRQTMMFSATVSSGIDQFAKRYTQSPDIVSAESYVDHSKLKQIYYDVEDKKKFSLFVHLLKKEKSNLVMVFCATRRNVDFVADNLERLGVPAKAIHGGLPQHKRMKIMKEFQGTRVNILVCTDVAARGLDIKGISHVYNYDLPKTSDEYIHRIGRTARAGKYGIAVNILCSRDYENFGNITKNELLKIENIELPEFERIEVKTGFGGRVKSRGGSFRGREQNREPGRPRNGFRGSRGRRNLSGSNKGDSGGRFGRGGGFSRGGSSGGNRRKFNYKNNSRKKEY